MLGIRRPFVHPERDMDGEEHALTLEYGSATLLVCCPSRLDPASSVCILQRLLLVFEPLTAGLQGGSVSRNAGIRIANAGLCKHIAGQMKPREWPTLRSRALSTTCTIQLGAALRTCIQR